MRESETTEEVKESFVAETKDWRGQSVALPRIIMQA